MKSLLAGPTSGRGVLDGQALAAAAQLVSGIGESLPTGRRARALRVESTTKPVNVAPHVSGHRERHHLDYFKARSPISPPSQKPH